MVTPQTNYVEILKFAVEAIKGELVLPFFQREFVWSNDLKESLFESFLNAEYLNNIITATLKNDVSIPVRRITSFFTDRESLEYRQGMEILVDGQQRITTLIEWLFSDIIGFLRASVKKFIPILYLKRNDGRVEIVKVEYVNKNGVINEIDLGDDIKKMAESYRKMFIDMDNNLFSAYLGKNLIERLKGKRSNKLTGYVLLSMALLEPSKYVERMVRHFVNYENDTLRIPAFLIRYILRLGEGKEFTGTLLDFLFENEEEEKLEDFVERGEVKKFIRVLERRVVDNKSKVTHVSFEEIDSVETLAEIFGKINTIQVKLGYFDIMESIIATIKGEPIDIRKFLDDEISSYQYVSFLGKVNNFHENFLRGFASWLEIIKLPPEDRRNIIRNAYSFKNLSDIPYLSFRKYIELNNRKISVGEYIKQIFEAGVKCANKNGKIPSDNLMNCVKEYIKFLEESLKRFDEITRMFTFYKATKSDNSRTLNLKGTILFFALPILESITNDERMKWKYFYEFAKFYLYSLFNSNNAFRHPEELIKNSGDAKKNIVITHNGVYFPDKYDIKEELEYFIEDFSQIYSENDELDLEYLSSSDYFMVFYIQSLYSFKRRFLTEKEELKREEVERGVSNEAYSLDGKVLSFSTSYKFDIHHIFPKKSEGGTVEYKYRDHALNLILLKKDKNQSISNVEPSNYWKNVIKDGENSRKVLEFNLIPVSNVPPTKHFIKPGFFEDLEIVLPDYSREDAISLLSDDRGFWRYRFIQLLEAIGYVFNFSCEEVLNKLKNVLNRKEIQQKI